MRYPCRFVLSAFLPLLLTVFLAWPTPDVPAQSATIYHGNARSRIYHRPGCRYYDCKLCVVVFKYRQEAEAAGYRGCKVCNP